MYSFLKAFLVLMKLLSLSQFYAPRFQSNETSVIILNLPGSILQKKPCSWKMHWKIGHRFLLITATL